MTNVIDAINELIKGVNAAYARGAYNMQEARTLINAIEFIGEAIKNQQAQTQAPSAQAAPATSADSNTEEKPI